MTTNPTLLPDRDASGLMDTGDHMQSDSNPADQRQPEADRLVADTRNLWEIRERVRRETDRSVIQRAWDVLLRPSRDR
jgi:hypothetical protein